MSGASLNTGAEAAGSATDPAADAANPTVFAVDADRLVWSDGRHSPEGYICASYSADRIALGKPIRKPFKFRSQLWVCVGILGGTTTIAKAYRLVPAEHFDGQATTYPDKTRDAAAARRDPNGFYHGMTVLHRGSKVVLCGPPSMFVPRVAAQFELFNER
ncbi:MAG: hypothetical protein H6813_06710 [Phycisphaeraceae bacterium]|nr:hypothetical protein [Phycisphaeraceae bacterium]MCB9848162.1 hypothetical protein [Phycisphaeraceae bacterium]